jgi:hypothetical protein
MQVRGWFLRWKVDEIISGLCPIEGELSSSNLEH